MEHVKCVTIISSIVTKNNVTTKMLQRQCKYGMAPNTEQMIEEVCEAIRPS